MAYVEHAGVGGSAANNSNGLYTKNIVDNSINTLKEKYEGLAKDMETEVEVLARKIGGLLVGPAGTALNDKITKYVNNTYKASSGLVNGLVATLAATMANKLSHDKAAAEALNRYDGELDADIKLYTGKADGSDITVVEKELELLDAKEYTNCDAIGMADKENFAEYVKEAFDNFDTKITGIIENFKDAFSGMEIFGDTEENEAARKVIEAGFSTLAALNTEFTVAKEEADALATSYKEHSASNIEQLTTATATFADTSKWTATGE